MTPKKGDIWVCVKDVCMNGNPNDVAYLKGKVYWSDEDYSITDENKNIQHRWVVEDKIFYEHFRRIPKTRRVGLLDIFEIIPRGLYYRANNKPA